MTETQTPNPDCTDCGGTGFVPPFMDECACAIPTIAAHSVTITPIAPIVGTLASYAKGDGTVGTQVWDGATWVPVATEALTPTEFHAKYGHHAETVTTSTTFKSPSWLPPLTSAPMVFDETLDEDLDPLDVDEFLDDEADSDALAEAAAMVDEVDAEMAPHDILDDVVELRPELPAPKTSKDTFADLVAACETVKPVAKLAPPHTMTEAQEKLMAKLVAERDLEHPVVAAILHETATTSVDKRRASTLIDTLMKVPADAAKKAPRPNSYDGICTDCKGPVAAGAGRIVKTSTGRWATYHLDGGCLSAEDAAKAAADRVDEPGLYKLVTDGDTDIYRVRKSRTSSRLYAERVCVHVEYDGEKTVTFAYNGKAFHWLRKSDRLTWAEARKFGAAYGACVACGRTLSDPRSLVQGYGATCAGHYRWPTVTTKQAEAIIAEVMTWEDAIAGLGVLTS